MSREIVFRTDTRLVEAMRRVFALLAERLDCPMFRGDHLV